MTTPTTDFNQHEYIALRFDALEMLIDERDKQYDIRFKASESAVSAALAAAEKQNTAAAIASEKAIAKAEASQTVYNVGHNDITKKMDAQYKEMIPRQEHDGDIRNLSEKLDEAKKDSQSKNEELRKEIASLKESRSEGMGNQSRGTTDQSRQQWVIMLLFGIFIFVLGIAIPLILNAVK